MHFALEVLLDTTLVNSSGGKQTAITVKSLLCTEHFRILSAFLCDQIHHVAFPSFPSEKC